MYRSFILKTVFVSFLAFSMVSCDKDEEITKPLNAVSKDFLVTANPQGGYSLFSFEKGELVTATQQSTDWDFGLRLITFSVNSGTTGPGNAGAIILDGVFDDIKTAPEAGYKSDAQGAPAIKDEWYNYNSTTRSFTPKAGKVFVFRTAKSKYAKMEILKADPTDDNGTIVVPPTQPTKIKYTVRYVFQPDGTKNF